MKQNSQVHLPFPVNDLLQNCKGFTQVLLNTTAHFGQEIALSDNCDLKIYILCQK